MVHFSGACVQEGSGVKGKRRFAWQTNEKTASTEWDSKTAKVAAKRQKRRAGNRRHLCLGTGRAWLAGVNGACMVRGLEREYDSWVKSDDWAC